MALVKFGLLELYEHPWIYPIGEDGKAKRRYRKKRKEIRITKDLALTVLKALFVPPASLAVWFGIISFFVMVNLTAGGT